MKSAAWGVVLAMGCVSCGTGTPPFRRDLNVAAGENLMIIDPSRYERIREGLQRGAPELTAAARRLRADALALCARTGPAVTDKTFTPLSPSRDPHDYVSVATYAWPNPGTPDGLPYVLRDGERSPDYATYDRRRWDEFADGTVTLIKAAYFLDEPRFASAAALRLRRWFLDPATRMNPHLDHSQFWPGRSTGSPFGIIEFSLYLPTLLDHVSLLAGMSDSPWTSADQAGLKAWCERFHGWLTESPLALEEMRQPNNHGTFYDRLVVSLALFLGHPAELSPVWSRVRERIGIQIEPDGSMPHELRRTCSFGYSMMNTRGFVELAWVDHRLGGDLWSFTTRDGRGIKVSVDFLYRHAVSGDPWPHRQIEPIDWRMLWPVLARANALGAGYDLRALAGRVPAGESPDAFVLNEPLHAFGKERAPHAGR